METAKKDTYKSISSEHSTIELKNTDFTLDMLNQLFNKKFINGHLLVYVDGELVFNDTVSDDLSQVIFDLIKIVAGNHEIKVEFTDNEGNTEDVTENITLN